jgi:hypothetical protein
MAMSGETNDARGKPAPPTKWPRLVLDAIKFESVAQNYGQLCDAVLGHQEVYQLPVTGP